MEIYSAKVHIQKVNEYLQDILAKNPKMYSKTKQRLREIGNEFSRGLNIISEILEEEALLDDEEFESNLSELSDVVNELYTHSQSTSKRMENLQKFVNNTSETSSTSLKELQLNSSKRKHIISTYGKALRNTAAQGIAYPKVAECAHLLWRWFDHRFFISVKSCPNFKYNIHRVPDWIRDIVIVYGKHVALGTEAKFIQEFNNWCDALVYSDAGEKYAIPLDIYECGTSMSIKYVTVQALGIWDILFDAGLNKLNDPNLLDFRLTEFAISDLFSQFDVETVDSYTYCNNNPKLLKEYKLLGGDEVE